ncbi:MAG: hypothetical protein HY055_06535, partial [Magnetospirillum sp.]|nr:hypothetical protein [Magnetospirillum sp.]
TMDAAAQAVKSLAGPLWCPISELIFDAMDDMVAQGMLNVLGRSSRLAITGDGRRHLLELVAMPLASPITAFGQVGLRLKLAFLDLAPPSVRRRQIGGIISACQCEIAARTTSCSAWQLNGADGRAWLDHQVEALEETVAVLRNLLRGED